MEPIRPSRGKARGRPQFPINQPGVPGLSNLPLQGVRAPRPTISQPIPSQTPVTGTMPRPPRPMPPRPTGAPQQRAPRPLGPRPGISSDNVQRPGMSSDNVQRPGMSSDNVQRPAMSSDNISRPGMSSNKISRPGMSAENIVLKQDPMAGVRIYLKFHVINIYLYAILF